MKALIAGVVCLLLLTACGNAASHSEAAPTYLQITAEQAKTLLDENTDAILLDVRTQSEYDEGHIPGALLLSDTEITARAAEVLPDTTALILVYCRSGRRSKEAAQTLANLGYTNVQEFGGILNWPYEITAPKA